MQLDFKHNLESAKLPTCSQKKNEVKSSGDEVALNAGSVRLLLVRISTLCLKLHQVYATNFMNTVKFSTASNTIF